MRKSREELQKEMLLTLSTKTGINANEDGSISKALIDAFGDEMDGLYRFLEDMREQAYVSTAVGIYLDLIGALVNTDRYEAETDDMYRIRIINAVSIMAGGNTISIENAILNTKGVASMELRPYAFGTGSFLAYIYPEVGENNTKVLLDVEAAIKEVVSQGIYFEVAKPTDIPVGIDAVLMFNPTTNDMEKRDIRNKAKLNLEVYLNKMLKNETLYINELIKVIMNTDEKIVDMGIVKLYIDENPRYIVNIFPKDNERFTVGIINIS